LKLLREKGIRANFLPHGEKHNLRFSNPGSGARSVVDKVDRARSTGEKAMFSLKATLADDASVVFLDEWDANLSPDNKQGADALIQTYAAKHVVVEIRHAAAAPSGATSAWPTENEQCHRQPRQTQSDRFRRYPET